MCGISGIYTQSNNLSELLYFSLFALQHRGQESVGVADDEGTLIKGDGLVTEVLKDEVDELTGNVGIGHVRYSTSIGSAPQPFAFEFPSDGQLCFVAHNGQVQHSNPFNWRKSDTLDIVEEIVAFSAETGADFLNCLINCLPKLKGSYSLVFIHNGCLYAARDNASTRPLVMGKLEKGGYIIASETCAFDLIGAKFYRDVRPGEIIRIDETGITTHIPRTLPIKKFCVFEKIYLGNVHSVMDGQVNYEYRKDLGMDLIHKAVLERGKEYVVIGVPDTGTSIALGFFQGLNGFGYDLSYEVGLIKHRNVGRSFIMPTQDERSLTVKTKLSVVPGVVKDKCVIVCDDSIVRGTTSKFIIQMLRDAGAKEVHFKSAAPRITSPCTLGVDIATEEELIANKYPTDEELAAAIGADSVQFLEIQNVTNGKLKYCTACMSSNKEKQPDEGLTELIAVS